ncbi:MAG: VWA domain-containing protein [Pyrinomonadaceae bacterium]
MHLRIYLLLAALFTINLPQIAAQSSPARDRERCKLGLQMSAPAADGVERQISSINPDGVPESSPAESQVIRIDTDLVILEFDVRDRRGRRIAGLTAGDFIIEENEVSQNIEVFSASGASETIGRSIILIIDYSNSQSPYIGTSISAAKTLLKLLEPNDRMAIVTDDVELLTNFTTDKAELERQLNRLHERSASGMYGKSMQFTALYRAIGELFDRDEKRPVVILQTDGDEFRRIGHRTRAEQFDCEYELNRFEMLERLIERSDTRIHSIIPGIRYDLLMKERGPREVWEAAELEIRSNPIYVSAKAGEREVRMPSRFLNAWVKSRLRDSAAVERIAKISGGTAHYLENPDQAHQVYGSILNEMNERYVVGYYPVSPIRDGARRSVRVRLRAGLEYKILGRSAGGGPSQPHGK